MNREILLQPESRLLSSSAANDFSLYGAQPLPGVAFAADKPSGNGDEGAASGSHPAVDATPEGATTVVQTGLPLAAPAADGTSAQASLQPTSFFEPLPADAPLTSADVMPLSSPLIPYAQASSDGDGVSQFVSLRGLASKPADEAAASASAAGPDAAIDDTPLALATNFSPLAAAALGPIPALAEDVGETLLTVVPSGLDAVTDEVQDLLGTDPAGGIATLVSLVTIEVFDLADVVSAPLEAVPAPVELIDLLADEAGELAPAPIHLDQPDGDDLLDPLLATAPHPVTVPIPDPDDLFGP